MLSPPQTIETPSKLLIIDRKDGYFEHKHFFDIVDYLTPNDVLVLNKTKVFPARFFGEKESGRKIEVLLIEGVKTGIWKVLTKPGIKVRQKVFLKTQPLKPWNTKSKRSY